MLCLFRCTQYVKYVLYCWKVQQKLNKRKVRIILLKSSTKLKHTIVRMVCTQVSFTNENEPSPALLSYLELPNQTEMRISETSLSANHSEHHKCTYSLDFALLRRGVWWDHGCRRWLWGFWFCFFATQQNLACIRWLTFWRRWDLGVLAVRSTTHHFSRRCRLRSWSNSGCGLWSVSCTKKILRFLLTMFLEDKNNICNAL